MGDSHPTAELIPFYVNGTLEDDERASVEEHLAACETCRAELEAARRYADLGREPAASLLEHVQAQHLDRFAVAPDELDPALASWIRDHLTQCPACRGAHAVLEGLRDHPELSLSTGAPRSVAPSAAARSAGTWTFLGRTVFHPAAAAVYLVLVLIAVPVLVRTARVAGKHAADEWAGAVEVPVISSALRGVSQEARVTLDHGRPFVALGLEFEFPDSDVATSLQTRIDDAAAETVWETSLEPDRVAHSLAEAGLVTLLVPANRLAPGRYRIVVEVPGETTPLLDAAFDVVP